MYLSFITGKIDLLQKKNSHDLGLTLSSIFLEPVTIVNLCFRYETSAHIWLVLEYCVGGDLLTLLRQVVCISLLSSCEPWLNVTSFFC